MKFLSKEVIENVSVKIVDDREVIESTLEFLKTQLETLEIAEEYEKCVIIREQMLKLKLLFVSL